MARLFPFRALRPAPAAAAAVAAVPYDVVNTDEARALASGQPLSFLHVSRAEIDLPADTDPYSPAVYEKAVANFAALRAAAPLEVEAEPTLYVYRLRMGAHVQTGVAACFSVDEYDRDLIKKHERTRRDKEDDRTRHILATRGQTGPVFLTYKASADVDAIIARATLQLPLFNFTAADGIVHTIWTVPAGEQDALVAAFGRIPALYIADGHHRAASAARARTELGGAAKTPGEWDTFLAVAFPDNQMQVLAYNRVVKDLAGETPESLLTKISAVHAVVPGAALPAKPGVVCMYLAGAWHEITLTPAPASASPSDRLDVSVLQDTVLTPLLKIGDVRSDKRIDFVGGARGTTELESLVESGRAAVAFSMFPVRVSDLMEISDSGGIMPPKSTWFEPKLRDGLLSHLI
ncbi:MAG: DUF1015 domain-containing protein [Vicinamibacterales bacterium]